MSHTTEDLKMTQETKKAKKARLVSRAWKAIRDEIGQYGPPSRLPEESVFKICELLGIDTNVTI